MSNRFTTSSTKATEIGQEVNDQGTWMLRKIMQLLKPLGIVTTGTNRLSVDINSAVISSGTVTTVSTVSSVTNQANMGNVNAFVPMKDSARNAYANGIRNNLSF